MVVDLVQTVVSILALLIAVYTIVLQRRAMAASSKLNAAATLFNYYNEKISSLRNSIMRDSADRERAQLDPIEKREARLEKLLQAHERMRTELEQLYERVA